MGVLCEGGVWGCCVRVECGGAVCGWSVGVQAVWGCKHVFANVI